MKIYFTDLTEEAQKRILKEADINRPEDANWDIFPITECDVSEDLDKE